MPDIVIKNPREYRLLKQLLKGPTSRLELNKIIGAINTPQNVKDIRDRHKPASIILTERETVTDRDGKKTQVGIYKLSSEIISDVKNSLEKWKKKQGAGTPYSKPENN